MMFELLRKKICVHRVSHNGKKNVIKEEELSMFGQEKGFN
jgi:hypothetical protein